MYIAGGISCQRSSVVKALDLQNFYWESLDSDWNPKGRFGAVSVVSGDKIILHGGWE